VRRFGCGIAGLLAAGLRIVAVRGDVPSEQSRSDERGGARTEQRGGDRRTAGHSVGEARSWPAI
jgi:hypothetical protein